MLPTRLGITSAERPGFTRLYESRDRLVERSGDTDLTSGSYDPAVDEVDLAPATRHQVKQHRGSRARDLQTEVADVGDDVVDTNRDPERPGDVQRLLTATCGDLPRRAIGDHLPDRAAENRAGTAERRVEDELLPDHLIDIVGGLDVEPGRPPDIRDGLHPGSGRPLALPEPDKLQPVVMYVTRLDDRGAETSRDADDDPIYREAVGCDVGSAQAVLNREDRCLGPSQDAYGLARGAHVHRLRGDDDELRLRNLGGIGSRVNAEDPVATRPLDAKASLLDRSDVLAPAIDCPQLVPGAGQEAGVDGTHRSGADHRDLHGPVLSAPVARRATAE